MLNSSNADPRCPFPTCQSFYYTDSYEHCDVTCNQYDFPLIGNSSIRINRLVLENLNYLPSSAFVNLRINSLEIYGLRLANISSDTFANVFSLDRLAFFDLPTPDLISQEILSYLENKTNWFQITSTGLNKTSLDTLLSYVKNWTKLNALCFLSNQLLDQVELDLSDFKINYLSLSGNNFESFKIKSSSLLTLDLNNNKIKEISPRYFDTPNLASLYLANNLISNLEFPNFTYLVNLDLSYNRLNSSHLNLISNLTTLQYLNLEKNKISYVEIFPSFPQLFNLNLKSNSLTFINNSFFRI